MQGGREVGMGGFSGEARLTLDGTVTSCAVHQPGTRLTGRISLLPPDFDLGAPFRAVFDYTFCAPEWCGVCEMQL